MRQEPDQGGRLEFWPTKDRVTEARPDTDAAVMMRKVMTSSAADMSATGPEQEEAPGGSFSCCRRMDRQKVCCPAGASQASFPAGEQPHKSAGVEKRSEVQTKPERGCNGRQSAPQINSCQLNHCSFQFTAWSRLAFEHTCELFMKD